MARVFDNVNRLVLPSSLPEAPAGEVHVAFVGESTMAGLVSTDADPPNPGGIFVVNCPDFPPSAIAQTASF